MYKIHVKRPVFVNRGAVRQTGMATAPPDLPSPQPQGHCGGTKRAQVFPRWNETLCPRPLRPRDLLMPNTPSGKPELQDPPGTKPFYLSAGWVLEGILALASAEHLCWAPWEVVVLPTSRTFGHLLYAKGSPSPSSCSQAGAWQKGSGYSHCHISGGLVELGFVKR